MTRLLDNTIHTGFEERMADKADHDYKSSLQQIAFFEKWFIQTQTTVPSRLRF
jgi:hypothetical protein